MTTLRACTVLAAGLFACAAAHAQHPAEARNMELVGQHDLQARSA